MLFYGIWLSEMIKYFILFTFLGFCIAKIIESQIKGFILIIIIAIAWGISTQSIWGLTTLGELLFGAAIQIILSKKNTE